MDTLSRMIHLDSGSSTFCVFRSFISTIWYIQFVSKESEYRDSCCISQSLYEVVSVNWHSFGQVAMGELVNLDVSLYITPSFSNNFGHFHAVDYARKSSGSFA
jgi:hypothetical protein